MFPALKKKIIKPTILLLFSGFQSVKFHWKPGIYYWLPLSGKLVYIERNIEEWFTNSQWNSTDSNLKSVPNNKIVDATINFLQSKQFKSELFVLEWFHQYHSSVSCTINK